MHSRVRLHGAVTVECPRSGAGVPRGLFLLALFVCSFLFTPLTVAAATESASFEALVDTSRQLREALMSTTQLLQNTTEELQKTRKERDEMAHDIKSLKDRVFGFKKINEELEDRVAPENLLVTCVEFISSVLWSMGMAFLTALWNIFTDPVMWFSTSKGQVLMILLAQQALLSRVLGLMIFLATLNGIAWFIRQLRATKDRIKWIFGWVIWLWDCSILMLFRELWSSSKKSTERADKNVEKLLTKMAGRLESLETALKSAEKTKKEDSVTAKVSPNPAQGKGSKKPCPNCDQLGHTIWTCPAPKRCFICHSTKHLARSCPKKSSANVVMEVAPPTAEEAKEFLEVSQAQCEDGAAAAATRSAEASGGTSRRPLMNVTAELGGAKVDCLIDTGSMVNVVSLDMARQRGWAIDTGCEEAQMTLKGFNGAVSKVVGTVLLPVVVGRWKESTPFVVTESANHVIFGMPALQDLKVTVDPTGTRIIDDEGSAVYCHAIEEEPPEFALEGESKND